MGKSLKKQLTMSVKSLEARSSGLKIVGKVPWGTHFCQFYKTQKDLFDILIPYFKAGLENNEFCVWVTSEFLTKEEALENLKKSIPQFSKYLKRGQIEIFPYTDWYLKTGKFELKRVLSMWIAKLEQGQKMGFDGMRVTGNPFWIDNKRDWDDFAKYEAEINKVIDPYNLLVLCTYSLEKCGASEVIDVVTNHEFALIKRSGGWELIESSEQKKMREALAESEQKYKSLFKNMINGFAYCQMIFDDKGKPEDFIYIEVNNAFEKLTGLKDVVGKKVTEVIPGIKKTNPELFEIYGKVALTGSEEKFEVNVEPLSIWLSILVYCPQKGYFVAVFEDITKRKNAEKEIEHLASFPRLNVNPIVELSLAGKVAYANPAAVKLFPNIKQKGIKHPLIEGFSPLSIKKISGNLRREVLAEGKWYSQIVAYVKESDSVRVYSIDISDRKKLEERQKNFTTIVGHELKNLITPISLSVQMMEKKVIADEKIKRAFSMIKNQTEIMSNLIKDLIDVSRIERNIIELQKEKIEVNALIRKAVEIVKPLIDSSNQKITLYVPNKKITVFADQRRIQQIILNLLSNASKYSNGKGKIRISVKQAESQVLVSIKDNGVGITKKSIENIFNLFSRGDNVKNGKKEGLGIGLYLSRELARLHEGDIAVQSEGRNKGSEFILKIPTK